MTRTSRFLAFIVTFVVAVALGSWVSGPRASAAGTGVALPLPAVDTCLICCDNCSQDPELHYAFDDENFSEEWYRNGGAHIGEPYCREYACDVRHGPYPCSEIGGLTDEDLFVLRTAITNRNPQVIARFVSAYPKSVTLNRTRGALQLLGCKGSVMEHLPLPSALFAAVVNAIAASEPAGSSR